VFWQFQKMIMKQLQKKKNNVEERERALRKDGKEIKPTLFELKNGKWSNKKIVLPDEEIIVDKVEDTGVVGYFKSWFV